jgi:hypothetical protein
VARALVELTHMAGPLNVSQEAYSRLATEATRAGWRKPFDRYGVAHTMRVILRFRSARKQSSGFCPL